MKWTEKILLIRPDRIWDAVWTRFLVEKLIWVFPGMKIDILASSYNKFIFWNVDVNHIYNIKNNPPVWIIKNIFKIHVIIKDVYYFWKKNIKLFRRLKKNKYDIVFNLTSRRRLLFLANYLWEVSVGWWTVMFDFFYSIPIYWHYEIWTNTHIVNRWSHKIFGNNLISLPKTYKTIWKFVVSNQKNIIDKKFLLFVWGKFPNKLDASYYNHIFDLLKHECKVDILTDNKWDSWNLFKLTKKKDGFYVIKDKKKEQPFPTLLKKYDYFIWVDWWVLHFASQYIQTIWIYTSSNWKSCYPLPFKQLSHYVITQNTPCAWCFQIWCKNNLCKKII